MNDVDVIQKKFKVIRGYHFIDTNKIDTNFGVGEYQRDVEAAHITGIENSMRINGFELDKPACLNQELKPIKGRHRCIAAINLGIKKIPAIIVEYVSYEEEAKAAIKELDTSHDFPRVQLWHAMHEANNPIAKLIYKLENDSSSLLFQNIAIKGKYTPKSKFSIGSVTMIINSMCLDITSHWSRLSDKKVTEGLEKISYAQIRGRTNIFLKWFIGCFGNKKDNPLPYNDKSIKAFLLIFNKLNEQNLLNTDTKMKSCIRKFSHRSSSFIRTADTDGIQATYQKVFNKGKKTKPSMLSFLT